MTQTAIRPYTQTFDEAEFRRLHRRGLTLHQLAEHFAVDTRTITRWRNRLGLAKPYVPPHVISDELREQIKAMFDDGASYQEVHKTFGIGIACLQKHFPGRGWTQPQIGRHGQAVMVTERKLRKMGVLA